MAQNLQDTSETATKKAEPASTTTDESKGTQAEKSLDDILSEIDSEFESGKKPEAQKPGEKEEKSSIDPNRLSAIEARLINQDVNEAVNTVKGTFDEGVSVPDRAIKGILTDLYNEDERFRKAFDSRDSSPAHWKRVLSAAARDIAKDFGPAPDSQTTSDREALASAVRGTRTVNDAGDEAPKFDSMSDDEFLDWKRKSK